MQKGSRFTMHSAAVLVVLMANLSTEVLAEHGWPIDTVNSEHPIGNTMGEFQHYGANRYQHTGHDILETPVSPMTRVTASGIVSQLGDVVASRYNGTTIDGVDGVTYRYWHLEHGSYDVNFVNNFNNGTYVEAGDAIAQLVTWTYGDFHHLHYDLRRGTDYLNPMASITPDPDTEFPDIQSINFARDNSDPWVQFNPAAANACTVVNGAVDIISQISDRNSAASTQGAAQLTNWIYNLRWRACANNNPDCNWIDTRPFDTLPVAWGNAEADAQFSNRAPWDSSSEYWTNTVMYGIVTNWMAGVPNQNGNWNTAAIADGRYSVSVEATDFAGNVTTYNVKACVQNGANCIRDLTIRDANDDTGAVPYPGTEVGASPDITVNSGTPNQDIKITTGNANAIQVRVWNYGNCNIPAGTNYTVCIGWGEPTSEAVPRPLPAAQNINCQARVVPAGGWASGSSLLTNFNWAPATGTIPEGDYAIAAWVDGAQDPVLDTFTVDRDDNRAQQNIAFGPPVAVCINGSQRERSCTVNGRQGTRTDTCVNGAWVLGNCRIPICIDGDERWKSCWLGNKMGWQRYVCRDESWHLSGGCVSYIP